jgi:hypothetical protein
MAQELSRINEQSISKASSQTLIIAKRQAIALSEGQYGKVSQMLPTKIEQAINEPKLFEMVMATNETCVIKQIEFELIILASLMSVGGNLNKAQVPFIARQLFDLYPKESLADFKICFTRGSMGHYGEIQRMDGITIRAWMDTYMEEKYQVLEDTLMREKDEIYARVDHTKPLIDVDKLLDKYKDEIKSQPGHMVPKMTEKEIKEEGQDEPKRVVYHRDENALLRHELKIEYARLFSDPLSYSGSLKPGSPTFEEWIKTQPRK